MANSTGEKKNSKLGPSTGPKHHLLKPTSPASARDYYNLKGPGTTHHKPKTPSRSPSVEPQEQQESMKEMNSLMTEGQPSQENNEKITERPTTPTLNKPPATETTLHAQHTGTQMLNYKDKDDTMDPQFMGMNRAAVEAAAEHNLDYVKVNECMYSILQDVDDIMYNQLSNIFDLLQWVANVVALFGLRVCDKQEQKNFNNHYNHETSEVTAYKISYKTITATNNTTMAEADRDKPSKACTELTTANIAIKTYQRQW